MKGVLHTDGGARGNPGPAGIGVVLTRRGRPAEEVARYIGEATNNIAEYQALIAGLELALSKGISELEIYVDSELVAAQVEGRWKIKNDRLRALAGKAQSLMSKFETVSINHVRRHLNSRADELANDAMDAGTVADGARLGAGAMTFDLDAGVTAEDSP